MSNESFEVREDIREAQTLPKSVYTDPALFETMKESIFAPSWQFLGDSDRVKVPGQICPDTLLEGYLDEPILLTRDNSDTVHCLANVCTHRGHLVAECGGNQRTLRCRYHGRRFGLDGTFQFMPEFEGVKDFPSEKDNLPRLPLGEWGKFLFASLAPQPAFEEWIAPMRERMAWLPLENFHYSPERTREYLVRANWALYVENYLDALHIPFVHNELNEQLDYQNYRFELFRHSNMILGTASPDEAHFDLPPACSEYGQSIAAYYFWLFPNIMFNFYPWGVSVNVVRPIEIGLTKVVFLRYVWDNKRLGVGVGDDRAVDRVEREDEAVVEATQRGVQSRFYQRGRYSPQREVGTHHFHRLLAEHLTTP